MKRRQFLNTLLLATFSSSLLASCKQKLKTIRGKITGASSFIGHILRDGLPQYTVSKNINHKVVIVGGGISGLSAARMLSKNNCSDFILLELEPKPGGNSSWGENELSQFPLGAHYIPTPNNDYKEYLNFLKEAGVINSFNSDGLPEYNEYHLCFDSQERLHINGNWQEGLVPANGLQQKEIDELNRFLQTMDKCRYLKGSDGKYAFDIPVANSSGDKEFLMLDGITMEKWLQQNNFINRYLHWYANYCTRDDFGAGITDISAWAGIHYFAARKGKGVNAAHSDVLTWPEGNGFLVKALMKANSGNIQSNSFVLQVKEDASGIVVDFMDTQSKQVTRVTAQQCIIATPQYVTARLINDKARIEKVKQHFQYTPWLVANIKMAHTSSEKQHPMSWDNVWMESDSLGYVVATHQLPQQQTDAINLTYYLPFTNGDATAERRKLHNATYETLCDMVIKDIEKVHPDIRETITDININIWGHSMVKPLPGIISGIIREELSASINNRIHFANSDLSGISIFEEAFYQGENAATKTLSLL